MNREFKKQFGRRILSLVLAFLMVFSVTARLDFNVQAEDTYTQDLSEEQPVSDESNLMTLGLEGEDDVNPAEEWYKQFESNATYTISSQDDFMAFAEIVNGGKDNFAGKMVELTTDVEITDNNNWISIGKSEEYPFAGTFDGKGHTVSGIITENNQEYYGVFASLSTEAVIKNIVITGTLKDGTEFTYYSGEVLTLDKEEIRLWVEEGRNTQQLTASILPETMVNAPIEWSSSNEEVAVVGENGVVTAVANGVATITAKGAGCEAECVVYVGCPVFFEVAQNGVQVTVTDHTKQYEVVEMEGQIVALLNPGSYSYTAKGTGYYASTCAFTVTEDGKVEFTTEWSDTVQQDYGLDELLDTKTGTFYISLETFTPSTNEGAWDGTTLDVSWFDPDETEFHIYTPEEFAGLAAIVNGIYNDEINTIIDGDCTFTPEEYAVYANAKIVAGCSSANDTDGPNGGNQVTSTDYYYSKLGYDFDGMTVYLETDLDMGGYETINGWTGARYMPIGGQYQMYFVKNGIADGFSHISSSFNGILDGKGHIVYNIYCDRYSVTNYGDSSTIGLVGRLGNHDTDYSTWKTNGDDGGNYPAKNPTVRNVAVDGYIYGRRSIGGIVGKIGKTSATVLGDDSIGGVVENCVNFAEVRNTDAKGCGGIVGAGWNAGLVRNCANFGSVSSTYNCPTGGIVGSNEISIVNCYSIGQISAKEGRYAMGIGSNNGGGIDIRNCYWLTGTAPGGGYYNWSKAEVTEITDNYNDLTLTAVEYMKSASFLNDIRGTGNEWSQQYVNSNIYAYMEEANASGMPVPKIFADGDDSFVIEYKVEANNVKTTYVSGEKFDTSGVMLWAIWNSGTEELVEDFTVSINGQTIERELTLDDSGETVTITANVGGLQWTKDYVITVEVMELDEISVKNLPDTCTYNDGDKFEPTGLTVYIKYTNGKRTEATYKEGKFVDEDGNDYDIEISPEAGTILTYDSWNDRYMTISYEYGDIICEISGPQLTVISKDAKPEQDKDGVYLVDTEEELDWIAGQVNGGIDTDLSFKLTKNIEINNEYTPIGNVVNRFSGTLDGCGYTVTMNIESYENPLGLFGYVEGASIKNVIVAGSLSGDSFVGGISGWAAGTAIENCGNKAKINTDSYAGGLIGYIAYETANAGMNISGCYNTGNVTTETVAGGIAGMITNVECNIKNCYNIGTVSGSGKTSLTAVGGIVGVAYAQTTISNTYNTGSINTVDNDAKYAGAIGGYINKQLGDDCYWLAGIGVDTIATAVSSVKITADTGKCSSVDELNESVLAIKGNVFQKNPTKDTKITEDCIPVLSWQTPTGHSIDNQKCIYCRVGMYKVADVNGDGEIDAYDSMLIDQNLVGWPTDIILEAADVNGDGEIDAYDSMLIDQYLVGWPVEFVK